MRDSPGCRADTNRSIRPFSAPLKTKLPFYAPTQSAMPPSTARMLTVSSALPSTETAERYIKLLTWPICWTTWLRPGKKWLGLSIRLTDSLMNNSKEALVSFLQNTLTTLWTKRREDWLIRFIIRKRRLIWVECRLTICVQRFGKGSTNSKAESQSS